MKNIDGRKLSTEAQQQLRYAAVRLCESEKTYTAAANALGISIEAVGSTQVVETLQRRGLSKPKDQKERNKTRN